MQRDSVEHALSPTSAYDACKCYTRLDWSIGGRAGEAGKAKGNGDERGKRWCGPCVLIHGHEQLTRKLGALANSLLQGQEADETECFLPCFRKRGLPTNLVVSWASAHSFVDLFSGCCVGVWYFALAACCFAEETCLHDARRHNV